jgi:hypothetical protein
MNHHVHSQLGANHINEYQALCCGSDPLTHQLTDQPKPAQSSNIYIGLRPLQQLQVKKNTNNHCERFHSNVAHGGFCCTVGTYIVSQGYCAYMHFVVKCYERGALWWCRTAGSDRGSSLGMFAAVILDKACNCFQYGVAQVEGQHGAVSVVAGGLLGPSSNGSHTVHMGCFCSGLHVCIASHRVYSSGYWFTCVFQLPSCVYPWPPV